MATRFDMGKKLQTVVGNFLSGVDTRFRGIRYIFSCIQCSNSNNDRSEKFFRYMHMKVVIFKSGLAVSVPKNANISGTILVMKIPKLGLCRGRLGLSCHIKI